MKENSLSRNTIILSAGALLTNGLQFLMVPFFSRWLSTSEYGSFDLCVTYATLLLPIISLATGEALFRFSIDDDNTISDYISSGLMVFLIGFVIVGGSICLVAMCTGNSILYPFCIFLFAQLLNNYCQALVRGLKKLNLYSLGSVITTISTAVFVTLFVYFWGKGVVGIVLGYAFGFLMGDIVILIAVKIWHVFSIKRISLISIKRMIKYSYPLIPNNISWWVLNTSDRVIISSWFSLSANGIYAIAHKVPGVCSNVFGMFNISWQQSATEALDKDKNELNRYYNDVYNYMLQQITMICAGLLSLNYILYHFVFDPKYSDAALYSPILIASIIFNSSAQFYGGIMISLKRPKDNGITTITSAIINIIMHIILIRMIGLYAAAVSTLIANMFLCINRKIKLRQSVKCSLSHKTYIYLSLFVYYLFLCYVRINLSVIILHIIAIATVFIISNKKYIPLLVVGKRS